MDGEEFDTISTYVVWGSCVGFSCPAPIAGGTARSWVDATVLQAWFRGAVSSLPALLSPPCCWEKLFWGGSPAPCCWAQCAPELRPLLQLLAVWRWEYLQPLWATDSTGSHPRDVQGTVSHLPM